MAPGAESRRISVYTIRIMALAEEAAQDEQHVRRPLGQASHEVRVPLGAVRHVDPHPVALGHQPALEVAPHAVQHLELEAVRADAALARGGADALDHLRIVGRDARVGIGLEQALGQRRRRRRRWPSRSWCATSGGSA